MEIQRKEKKKKWVILIPFEETTFVILCLFCSSFLKYNEYFRVQECIFHNIELNNKVFAAFMNVKSAYGSVWHETVSFGYKRYTLAYSSLFIQKHSGLCSHKRQ